MTDNVDRSIWKRLNQVKRSKMIQKERDAEDKIFADKKKETDKQLKKDKDKEKKLRDRLNLEKQKEDKKLELEKFSFSNISDNFDEHIDKSITGYDQLRDDIVSLSKYFVVSESNVHDLCRSQGTMIKRIRDTNTQAIDTNYYGIDINPSFSSHWKNVV